MIKEIHGTSSNLGKVALLGRSVPFYAYEYTSNLGRIFRCYPSVAFLDPYDRILEAPESTSKANVELLSTTAETFDALKDTNFPQAYFSRLHDAMLWCIKVARAVTKFMAQHRRQQYQNFPLTNMEPWLRSLICRNFHLYLIYHRH